jgi:hypothetical protein
LPAPNPIRSDADGSLSVSHYEGNILAPADIALAVKKLSVAFPRMGGDFWNLLAERIRANGFTAERLKHAVDHVVDNFRYKELNISDVVSYDRRVRLYTGREFENAQMKGVHPSEFERRTIGDVLYFVKKTDLKGGGTANR